MTRVTLQPDSRGYLTDVVRELVRAGWIIKTVPQDGAIARNGLKIVLRTPTRETRVRLFAYKITTSGRSKPHERRVEITTTYRSTLKKEKGFRDIILATTLTDGVYVGVDSKRLWMGGDTHNASSFFDREGLSAKSDELLITPRQVASTRFAGGIENHAFFRGDRLAEYLINHEDIHNGVYNFSAVLARKPISRAKVSTRMKASYPCRSDVLVMFLDASEKQQPTISSKVLQAVERRDFRKVRRQRITPGQLRMMLAICDEIGTLGEQAVLAAERKRLKRLGLIRQAEKVERVSLRSVSEGYDIVSFEDDGTTKRFIEVKATSGTGWIVDVSLGEWAVAESLGKSYYIVRVRRARAAAPDLKYFRNPAGLVGTGLLKKTPGGWRVNLKPAP